MNERSIIIGLITSTEFIKLVRSKWDSMLLESGTARTLANWCIEYYDEYKEAPGKQIETIYYKKVSEGSMDEETAEEIEEDLLPDLNEEFLKNPIENVKHLVAETLLHLNSRKLAQVGEQMTLLMDSKKGDLNERVQQAEQILERHRPIKNTENKGLSLHDKRSRHKALEKAFTSAGEPVIKFPKQAGKFFNEQLLPGAFVSFLAPEKRGKSWLLMEFAKRAVRQGKNVAFFQAGDMNEAEQLKRMAIYDAKRGILPKYCKEHYACTRDCLRNQMDVCTSKLRECHFGVFSDMTENQVKELDYETLVEAYESNLDYTPCYGCKEYDEFKLGMPWIIKNEEVEPLTLQEAIKITDSWYRKSKGKFKLSTHANGTLSVKGMEQILDEWEAEEGFIPHVILIDYMDILMADGGKEFRHQENQKWKDMRRVSQTPRGGILPLVISPTQADADSYKQFRLSLSNYSEDKRKYAHVTAFYGLNQDPKGREKKLGLLRINQILMREGESSITEELTLIANLKKGHPLMESMFQKL